MYITAYKQIAVCLGHLHKNGAFKSDILGNKVIAISGKECCSLFWIRGTVQLKVKYVLFGYCKCVPFFSLKDQWDSDMLMITYFANLKSPLKGLN